MRNGEIIKRCVDSLGMALAVAEWVAENLYTYAMPDFSEWSWGEIDQCFRDVAWFYGKSEAEILEALCVF